MYRKVVPAMPTAMTTQTGQRMTVVPVMGICVYVSPHCNERQASLLYSLVSGFRGRNQEQLCKQRCMVWWYHTTIVVKQVNAVVTIEFDDGERRFRGPRNNTQKALQTRYRWSCQKWAITATTILGPEPTHHRCCLLFAGVKCQKKKRERGSSSHLSRSRLFGYPFLVLL
jgi:hypothetical protein